MYFGMSMKSRKKRRDFFPVFLLSLVITSLLLMLMYLGLFWVSALLILPLLTLLSFPVLLIIVVLGDILWMHGVNVLAILKVSSLNLRNGVLSLKKDVSKTVG